MWQRRFTVLVFAPLALFAAAGSVGCAVSRCPEISTPEGAPEAAARPTDTPKTDAAKPATAKADEDAVAAVLDDWHDAASRADEERYFKHLDEASIFLGTDATERWDKATFRAYARPHFAKGKAWSFRAVRRVITIAPGAALAWFDEDLATPNLGPARGSGVLVRRASDGPWRIAQYNLSVPIPNDRFEQVKRVIAGGVEGAAKP